MGTDVIEALAEIRRILAERQLTIESLAKQVAAALERVERIEAREEARFNTKPAKPPKVKK